MPDPRGAGRGVIDPVLAEIVAAEGSLSSRAYGLYNRAAGGKKLYDDRRAPLSGATYRLRMAGGSSSSRPTRASRARTSAPAGACRARARAAARARDEPLDEIAELMPAPAAASPTPPCAPLDTSARPP